jgi:hypothetical protein
MRAQARSRAALTALITFAFFALAACLALYWNLIHANTHVGGSWTTDYYHFHWNYWWIRHALTTPGLSVYETNFVLFPYTTNLAFHTLTPLWYPLWALLEPLTGTLIAMNIIMVLAMALTGWATYLLLRTERVPASLALAGGLLVELAPSMMLAAMLTTINYLSQFWIPISLLTWRQVALRRDDTRRGVVWALLMGAVFYATMLTDYQIGLFLTFLLVPYGVLTLIRAGSTRARLRLAGLGAIALITAAALLWFAGPLPHIVRYDFASLAPQRIEDAMGIPFPDGFFGRFKTYERVITLGALLIPAALITVLASVTILRGRVRDSRRWFWLALAVAPLLLALGPTITIGGQTIETPYVALHQLFGGLFRSPARFDIVLMIALLLFIGRTWGALLRSWGRAPRYGVAAAAVLLVALDARLFEPMPIQPVTTPYAFYEAIGAERGDPYDDYAIIEVPVAGGSGEAWVGEFRPMEAHFYGMTHGKRMLNGAIARAPLSSFWYWLVDDPMLAWLGQRRYLEPENVEAQLRERIYDWPVGYIVIHQDWVGLSAPTNQEIIGYFNTLPDLVCPVYVEGYAVAYRTAWHPDSCPPRTPPQSADGAYVIDIGAPDDVRYIGWGWHYAEQLGGLTARWTGEYPQTQVYIDLPPADYRLSLSTQAFHQPRALRVLVNGQPLAEPVIVSTEGLQTLAFDLPAALIGEGRQVTITLDYDGWTTPAELGQGADQRKLALLVDWLRFEPTSVPE